MPPALLICSTVNCATCQLALPAGAIGAGDVGGDAHLDRPGGMGPLRAQQPPAGKRRRSSRPRQRACAPSSRDGESMPCYGSVL